MPDDLMRLGELQDGLDFLADMADPAILVLVEHRGHPAIQPLPVRGADLRTDAAGVTRIVLTVGD